MHLVLHLYVFKYVCPSHLEMLIFCTRRALKVRHAHVDALFFSAGRRAPVLEYDGSICKMDNRPTKDEGDRMQGAIKGTIYSPESLGSHRTVPNVMNIAPPTTRLGVHA